MKKYLSVIHSNSLFAQFSSREILLIIPCIDGQISAYKSGNPLILAGDRVSRIGILLEGELSITETDIDGNISLINKLRRGDTFGEAFAISGKPARVNIQADTDSVVLFLPYSKIISACTNACQFHTRLINNLISTLAGKLVHMQAKLDILHRNTIKTRLEAYFDHCILESGSLSFTIPLSRSELAEYIGVNRSAMHRELKKMQEQGLIKISGRVITELKPR